MAKTVERTIIANWGTEGIGSEVSSVGNGGVENVTNNSFTCKHGTVGTNQYRVAKFYESTLLGNKKIKKITVSGTCSTDASTALGQNTSTTIGVWREGNVAEDTFIQSTTVSKSGGAVNFSFPIDISSLTYNSEGYYALLLGGYKNLLRTFYWYFSNVNFDITYETTIYTLNITAGTGGTVTGGGDYETGTTATIKATPNTGYKFVKWSDGNTNATRTVTVTADTTLTAVFEKLTYTITFKNEDGTILQASSVAYGDMPKYTGATPTKASTAEYSYAFSGWSPSLAAVTGAATYTAKFTATKRTYAITVNAGEGGSVSGDGTYPYGSTVQITATAKEGWEFKGWSDGNTDNPRTITVTGVATYTAVFEEKAPLPEMLDFKIINPRNNMQVTKDNPLEAGQEYLIELTANQ